MSLDPLLDQKPPVESIFNGFHQQMTFKGKEVSQRNVSFIPLGGKLDASLNWKKELEVAREAVSQNKQLIWDLELGLFSTLKCGLSEQGQFMSLSYALEFFRTEIWPEFKDFSLGVSLYQGPFPFNGSEAALQELRWAFEEWLERREETPFLKRYFFHKTFCDYLNTLATLLPDEAVAFIKVQKNTLSFEEILYFSSKEFFAHFQVLLDPLFLEEVKGILPSLIHVNSKKITRAVLLPSVELEGEIAWRKIESLLSQISDPFLYLTENQLTHSWDGIDELFVFSQQLSPQAERKLKGFCAAGGSVLSL